MTRMVLGKRHLVVEEVGLVIRNLILLLVFALFFGCSDPVRTYTIESNTKNWHVEFFPHPTHIPLNTLFEMHCRVKGGGEVRSLRVDAAMPAHGHGMMTQSVTTFQDDGWFITTGMILHMPGEWDLYFDVDTGEAIERAQVTFTLQP